MEEKENKNPLASLKEFYDKTLKEKDAKGYSEIYKACFESLKKYLSNIVSFRRHKDITYSFNIINEALGDGYFIFARGTNSTIEFEIKELPNWLFGLWFVDVDDNHITADLFWQYKDLIDKFKPSASAYCFRISFNRKDNQVYHQYDLENTLIFTLNEPALAFCREFKYWDYNHEYHSRLSAKWEFFKYNIREAIKQKRKKKYEEKMLKWVNIKLSKLLGFKVHTVNKGEGWYPQYELITSVNNVPKELIDEDNCIYIEDLNKKAYKKFIAKNNHYKKWCYIYEEPTHDYITILKEKDVEKILEEKIDHEKYR